MVHWSVTRQKVSERRSQIEFTDCLERSLLLKWEHAECWDTLKHFTFNWMFICVVFGLLLKWRTIKNKNLRWNPVFFSLYIRFCILNTLLQPQSWCAFPVLWFLSCCGSTRGSWSPSSILSFLQLLIHSGTKKQSKRMARVTIKLMKREMRFKR